MDLRHTCPDPSRRCPRRTSTRLGSLDPRLCLPKSRCTASTRSTRATKSNSMLNSAGSRTCPVFISSTLSVCVAITGALSSSTKVSLSGLRMRSLFGLLMADEVQSMRDPHALAEHCLTRHRDDRWILYTTHVPSNVDHHRFRFSSVPLHASRSLTFDPHLISPSPYPTLSHCVYTVSRLHP